VRIGNLELGSLAPGRHRALSAEELSRLVRSLKPARWDNGSSKRTRR